MINSTQAERYKLVEEYLNTHFKSEVSIAEVERIACYSYRNINRIFYAIHNETIGQYVKRLKLEKAAEYLKYSSFSVAEIAVEIGYNDSSALIKAFKKQFGYKPSTFRKQGKEAKIDCLKENERQFDHLDLSWEIEKLPEFEIIYSSHYGSYYDLNAIGKKWNEFVRYVTKKGLVDNESIFLGEVIDDTTITADIFCRYNMGLVLAKTLDFSPKSLFKTKTIRAHRYVKFMHKGSYASMPKTYNQIYGIWMFQVGLEFADMPILEFYLNDESTVPESELLTEIYIPVL